MTRVAVNPDELTTATAIAALPDTTNLRLLTWAASSMLVDKPSKVAEDADTTELSNDAAVDG